MKLVYYPDKILTEKTKPVRNYGKSLSKITEEMKEFVNYMGADGLAAPQVGLNKRMFVARIQGALVTFVNPKVIKANQDVGVSREGCLSAPGVMARLDCRSVDIEVEAKDAEGKSFTKKLYGTDAIVFQHEYDHLDGITVFERMSKLQRRLKIKRLAKAKRRHHDRNG